MGDDPRNSYGHFVRPSGRVVQTGCRIALALVDVGLEVKIGDSFMSVNACPDRMRPGLQPTDTRLKPDQRNCLRSGKPIASKRSTAPHGAREQSGEEFVSSSLREVAAEVSFICRWRGVLSVFKDRGRFPNILKMARKVGPRVSFPGCMEDMSSFCLSKELNRD